MQVNLIDYIRTPLTKRKTLSNNAPGMIPGNFKTILDFYNLPSITNRDPDSVGGKDGKENDPM